MNEPLFNDLPMILETPYESDETYAKEIKLLNSLIDKWLERERKTYAYG